MQFDIPVASPASSLLAISPSSSRSSSLAGRPRKPSPLRRSSTPDDAKQLGLTSAGSFSQVERDAGDDDVPQRGETSSTDLGRGASEGSAIASAPFVQSSLSQSASDLTESASSSQANNIRTPSARPNASSPTSSTSSHSSSTKTIGNGYYTLPPIRTTPKFPHSASLRPLRPLSSTTSGGGSGSSGNIGVGSLSSVPHAGAAANVGRTRQRQKIIVPTKSWKACFDLNLTQKELARFD
ncbi:hypothetical protein QFC22_001064 [Naganishia vaughanmartiniae]|uniref:Uncharacterized protein n=1 Tax=Naganishia vaughanmartiniae TaxID=1424756 RepID=A0ACC2XKX7_9TREE|nr:hypothetical protein QFC22_001064 [Naganishia vaughanmartiniae]